RGGGGQGGSETGGAFMRRGSIERGDGFAEPENYAAASERARGVERLGPEALLGAHRQRRIKEHDGCRSAGSPSRDGRVPEQEDEAAHPDDAERHGAPGVQATHSSASVSVNRPS